MKTIIKVFLIGFIFIGLSLTAYSQATVSASTTAKIITPLRIDKNRDLDFGTIAASTSPETVDISTAGIRTKTGALTLVSFNSTHHSAEFETKGQDQYTFTITLPTSTTLTNGNNGNGNNMIVDNFISSPSLTGALDNNGERIITVGARLHVGANQNTGVYTNANDLKVTVNYN